jgi:hypothetical protein
MSSRPSSSSTVPTADFDALDPLARLIAKAGARDRTNLEKQLTALDAGPNPDRGRLWRRLLVKLASLVSLPPVTTGPHVVQFFRPDGKYRMQVFALEDADNGLIYIYMADVLATAVERKLLVTTTAPDGTHYATPGITGQPLPILVIDNATMPNPPAYVKHMTGWNRRAVRVTLMDTVISENDPRVLAVEALVDLAAEAWANEPTAPAATTPTGRTK